MAYTFTLIPSSDFLFFALLELKFIIGNKTQTSDVLCVLVMRYRSTEQSCVYSEYFTFLA